MYEEMVDEESLQGYLKNIADHPILTREEEVDLFQRVEAGEEFARTEIVRCNLRLVVKIALQFRGYGVPMADLVQEGNIGLLNVISKFDWRKGFRFSTYAAFWIRQEIQAALRTGTSLIRLPVRKARLLGKMSEAIRSFNRFEGRDPRPEELAELLDADLDTIELLLPLRESVLSLEMECTPDGGTLMQTIADDAAIHPETRMCAEELTEAVQAAMHVLTEREREVMELRYGLNGGRSLSLRKTSRIVGLSQEGVRRIERRALDKLRRPGVCAGLHDLLIA